MNLKNRAQLEALDPRVGQLVYLASSNVTNYTLVSLRVTFLLTPRALEKIFDPMQAARGAKTKLCFFVQ